MSYSRHSSKILVILTLSLAISACGFHLRESYNLPDEIQTLSVTSFDPYGKLSREMKNRLRLHHIELTEPKQHIANLHLKGEGYGESTLSLYQNATVAQRQFTYSASYSVMIPEKGIYDFSTSLNRSYIDNPLTALAKSVEVEMLVQEMRVEATKQIMRQLARLNARIEEYDREQAEERARREMYQTDGKDEINVEIRSNEKENEKETPQSPSQFKSNN